MFVVDYDILFTETNLCVKSSFASVKVYINNSTHKLSAYIGNDDYNAGWTNTATAILKYTKTTDPTPSL